MRSQPPPGSPTGLNRLEYEKRVNRVIDYLRDHLADELTLAGLARVAAFSPFHFHRLFTAIVGETLFGFIQRVRIEKAAGALRLHPGRSVLDIALDHGFSSAATFARSFKAHFGMSATEWRAGGAERWRKKRERKPGQPLRNGRKATRLRRSDTRRTREGSMNVRVTAFPVQHVAYMRYVGPYGAHGIPALWKKLNTWMEARDLRSPASITLGVAYDDASITEPDKCRYDACVVVPRDFVPERMNVMDVAGGKYAVADFQGTAHEIIGVWDRVFRSWLPESGYEPDDRACFELYRGHPTVDAKQGIFRCELCLPVRPM